MSIIEGTTTLALKNTIEFIYVRVVDSTGALVDATTLSLQVFDQFENLLIKDNISLGYGDPPSLPSHIAHPSTGVYYFPLGDTSFDATNNKNDQSLEYIFMWSVGVGSAPIENVVQLVKTVSVKTMRLVPKLRLIIDKAVKAIDDNPEDPVFVGYNDWMLTTFLDGGLSWINGAQPYPMWGSVDDFPDAHYRILLDGATVDALTSQELFAVDTDINYSDQGNVFVIDHQPKLSAILNSTLQRFMSTVQPMKLHYLNNGAIRVEIGPNFRFSALLNAAPDGALFRNAFMSSTGL